MKELALENSTLEPYIVLIDEKEAHLVIDKEVVDEIDVADIPCALMSAFFVFNICYPKGCNNFIHYWKLLF